MHSIYEATFNALPVGATIVKRENPSTFIIQDINESSASVTSRAPISKDQVIGVAIDKIFVGVREAGLLDRYNEALDSGSIVHLGAFEYEDRRTPAGIFSIDLIPLSENHLLITFSNVTARVKAEQSRLESEARFRAMTESSPDHIMRLNTDGIILYINRTVPDLTIEEVVGTAVFQYVPEHYQNTIRDSFAKVLESGTADAYMLEYRSKSGDLSLFETSVGPIIRDNEVTGFITYSRDITKHREAESTMSKLSRQLLRAQEEERRRIAQELHDEVGGLLTSIQISLELIPEEQRSSVKQLRNLSSLIDALQDQVRDVTLTLRPNTLDHLGLEAALKLYIGRFTERTQVHVCLASDLEADARFSPDIETAAYRVTQEALTNVARHAKTNNADVKLSLSGDYLVLEVCDTGIGFEFSSIGTNSSSLGLSGMHHRASVLGGEVTISTQIGSGTTVKALFPLNLSGVG